MYKFIATISNRLSPLEEFVFDSPKIVELSFENFPTNEEILTKLEPIVFKLKGDKKVAVSIEVAKENGSKVFMGIATADGRLHGTAMS